MEENFTVKGNIKISILTNTIFYNYPNPEMANRAFEATKKNFQKLHLIE
jgi:hypothetical protein